MIQTYTSNKERYQVISGQKLKPYGEVLYGVVTGEGDGPVYYEGGKEVLVAGGGSIEYVGKNLKNDPQGEPVLNPAKLIHAYNGDIVLEAPNGKIILSASQIEITATGNKLNKTGSVFIAANVTTKITATNIEIKGTKTVISGSHSTTLIGKNYLDLISSFQSVSTNADLFSPCGSFISKTLGVLERFTK